MNNLINYLADDSGEIHAMKIKEYYQNDMQREEYEDTLTQAFCICGVELNGKLADNGELLCIPCNADSADALVNSFHQAFTVQAPGHKGIATKFDWGGYGATPIQLSGVG